MPNGLSHFGLEKRDNVFVSFSQIVLSSSWKRVEIVSQDKFNYQRDALEPPRARSFTEDEFPPPSPPITAVPHATLSPSAEVFRPRAHTAPPEPLSRSLPAAVPEFPMTHEHPTPRHGSRTPKRKDVKVAPRFFPAISKENVSDQGPKKRKTKYSQNPPVEHHVGWVMSNKEYPPPRRSVLLLFLINPSNFSSQSNVQRLFFDQLFSWSFWSSSTLPRLVVLHCILLHFVDVMCCDLSLTCYPSLLA